MNRTMEYFKSVGFDNISEARVVLHKAKKENYPKELVNELQNKIQEYQQDTKLDIDLEVFK